MQKSPAYPVKELRRVLPQLLTFMCCVPREETIIFAKIDLSDGFWRMLVHKLDKWNFAYVLPGATADPLRLIIPHALQMGWRATSAPPPKPAATLCRHSLMGAPGYPLIYLTRTCSPMTLSAAIALPWWTADHGKCQPSMPTTASSPPSKALMALPSSAQGELHCILTAAYSHL
jgi:hypothetical protein